MTKYHFCISIFVASLLFFGCGSSKRENNWIPLFNGKNLTGWTPKFAGFEPGVNYKNTFRVDSGMLRVKYDDYERFDGRFGHLFFKQPYSHYKIRVVYRFVGEQVPEAPAWAWRNNGIKYHSQSPESMSLDQSSPVSIEVQLLGGDGKSTRTTANMCSMGTHVMIGDTLVTQHCFNSSSETYSGNQWVEVVVEVHGGDLIRHFVNGEQVLQYHKPQYDTTDQYTRQLQVDPRHLILEQGYIAIQAESHPTDFKIIELLPLED